MFTEWKTREQHEGFETKTLNQLSHNCCTKNGAKATKYQANANRFTST